MLLLLLAATGATAKDIPISLVTCDTTKGQIEMTFYRDYSPHGYDRAVQLFQEGFYDGSHFFRVVPRFLVQFGISYTADKSLKARAMTPIKDDRVIRGIQFEPGTISFAGSGRNSRTSHLFISLMRSNQFGTNPWETPIGRVTKGMDVVRKLESSYGDMPPWGKGPEQAPIYDGPQYIEENFPLLDKFIKCTVDTIYTSRSNIPPTANPDSLNDSDSDSDSDSDDEDSDSDSDSDSDDGGDEF